LVQDRLVIEGGALKPNEKVAKSTVCYSKNEAVGNVAIISNHTIKTRSEAEPKWEKAPFSSSSHIGCWLEANKTPTLPIYGEDSIRREYIPVKSSIPNSMTTPPKRKKDATDHFPQEKNTLKRKYHTNAGIKSEEAQMPKRIAANNKKHESGSPGASRMNQAVQAQMPKKTTANIKRNKSGASGDPRMNQALQAKLDNPNLSLVAALMRGGFVFESEDLADSSGLSTRHVRDADNISLYQRRNQLMRRLRYRKKKTSVT